MSRARGTRWTERACPLHLGGCSQDDFLAALRREKHIAVVPCSCGNGPESIAAHARAGRRGKQRGRRRTRTRGRERDRKPLLSFVEGIERARDEEPTGSTLNPSRISIQCSQYHARTRSRRSSASASNRPPRISIVESPRIYPIASDPSSVLEKKRKIVSNSDALNLPESQTRVIFFFSRVTLTV